MWRSLDYGVTWKVFYKFGQTPNWRDDGSATGSEVTGDLLGDAGNAIYCRHIHSINKGSDGNYYVATGDTTHEMHFMKLVYNSGADTWTVTDLLAGTIADEWQRMRAIGIIEKNGYIYWGSDGIGDTIVDTVTYESHGIYRCLIADLGDITKHELLQATTDECFAFLRLQGDVIFCGMDANYGKCYISKDGGDTWTEEIYPFTMSSTRPAHFDSTNEWLIVLNNYIIQSL